MRRDHRQHRRRPELSQHFLRGPAIARRVVRHLGATNGIPVLDIGAGDGALTLALAESGRHVIAIEKDRRLYERLRRRTARFRNVRCVRGDFLDFELPRRPYAVASNVPYGITASVMRKLLHAARPPDEALLVLQREAAEKFAGTPRETRFSLLAKPRFAIEIVGRLRRGDFAPPPAVDSVVLRLMRREGALVPARSMPAYSAFINATFGYGHPSVARGLRRHVTPTQLRRLSRDLGFQRGARASELTFEQWLGVFRFVEHECLGHDPTRAAA